MVWRSVLACAIYAQPFPEFGLNPEKIANAQRARPFTSTEMLAARRAGRSTQGVGRNHGRSITRY